jgi:HSP20 family molecular chaperone IbpA
MFGDDSFMGIEDLFNQLARGRGYSSRNARAQTQNLLNTVESRKETILIFDLSGKKVLSIEIKDELEINEYGERVHSGEKVLAIKLEDEETLKYTLPKSLGKKIINHTFKNGILEVYIRK